VIRDCSDHAAHPVWTDPDGQEYKTFDEIDDQHLATIITWLESVWSGSDSLVGRAVDAHLNAMLQERDKRRG